jgi:hypothetical protein
MLLKKAFGLNYVISLINYFIKKKIARCNNYNVPLFFNYFFPIPNLTPILKEL